jgi:hypothetical protein
MEDLECLSANRASAALAGVAQPSSFRAPRMEGEAGSPVAVVWLPGRRAGLEGCREKSPSAPQQHGHDGAERRHAWPTSRTAHRWSRWLPFRLLVALVAVAAVQSKLLDPDCWPMRA